MFENTIKYETSLSRAHNSSYSDVLFHFTRTTPASIPINFSNSYFYDLLASGFGRFSGVTYSFSKKFRFGITNGPHEDPDVTNLSIYGFTTIDSDFRNFELAGASNNLSLNVFTTKVGLQDFLCFTFSHIGTAWSASDEFTILCKGTVVTCPILWDYHAHKFFADSGFTQSSVGDQIRTSVTRLVCDLKSKYLWNKLVCLYPFVGGTSESHKWNLKNTSTYSLIYSAENVGTVSHHPDGVQIITPSNGFINTGFQITPATRDLAMGVYTNQLVNYNWPFNPTYSVGNLMGSFTTSTSLAGGQLHYSISTFNITGNIGLPRIVYMDVDPVYLRGRFSSQLSTNLGNNTPMDRGGLWAMARLGSTFSYTGLLIPGIIQLNTQRWYYPFESQVLNGLKNTFGRKRVYLESTLGLNYFTSSIFIGNISGTLSAPSNQKIKSAFIGFSMSGMDLLYMSEILTKFNHSLNRE
jgi:hypothetical protein